MKNKFPSLLGDNVKVPVFGGEVKPYINLDYAATTPPFKENWDKLNEIMPMYGSVHRGSGYKSLFSSQLYDKSINEIYSFSDAKQENDLIVIGVNTTHCINILARRLCLKKNSNILLSKNEHTSNFLPWKKHGSIIECNSLSDGTIDFNDLEQILKREKIGLVVINAASNVTGIITKISQAAKLAHQYGAKIFVDASQFVAHRPLKRSIPSNDDYIDFVVYSGHKMYAPFGTGVLVASKDTFTKGWPDSVGGGTVKLFDDTGIIWSDIHERESGGTPNFPGVFMLAESCKMFNKIGFQKIIEHEKNLISCAVESLSKIDNLQLMHSFNKEKTDLLPVFSFSIKNYNHAIVGAYLGFEHAIGVRTGTLCQFSLIKDFLNIKNNDYNKIKREIKKGNVVNSYGIIRASCGIGTTVDEIKKLGIALELLNKNGTKTKYKINNKGEYIPIGWAPKLII